MSSRKGTTQQKIILLLLAGLGLGLTRSHKKQWRIVKGLVKEWREIDRKSLTRAVNTLYASKMVRRERHANGEMTIVLSDKGKKYALRYRLDTLTLKKPKQWDGKWHMVMYDIPENKRGLRMDMCRILRRLGFYEFQQSVWVYPFPCNDEIDFLIEAHNARAYIRRVVADEIDMPALLLKHFGLQKQGE